MIQGLVAIDFQQHAAGKFEVASVAYGGSGLEWIRLPSGEPVRNPFLGLSLQFDMASLYAIA